MFETICGSGRKWAAGLWLAVLVGALAGCGGGSGDAVSSLAPQALAVEPTSSVALSETVSWTAPVAVSPAPTSYEIYRSTTEGTTFSPENHLASIPAVNGKATYSFVDDAGLSPVDTFWVVTAKSSSGETPSSEAKGRPAGVGKGGNQAYGNNLSAPLIFADGIGLAGATLSGSWTQQVAALDYATGLRPLSGILPSTVTTLPYLESNGAYVSDGVTYYRQGTASTWQAQWSNGAGVPQHVQAAWSDNLVSQSLTTKSSVRVEMVLSQALASPMTAYAMKSLYGTQTNEVQGTDGTTYASNSAFVFAANVRLTVQKLDAAGTPVFTAIDQTLWQGDGPGYLMPEVTVAGNFTYGMVWQLKNQTMPAGVDKAGTWRLTFTLMPQSPLGTANNTFIDGAGNGVLDSSTQAHIDIQVSA